MKSDAAGTARILLSIIGFISLIIGLAFLFIGLLLFLGINVLSAFLPKSVISAFLPSDINFISGAGIVLGISIIVFSRLFHASSKWLKENRVKGGVLAILLSVFSLLGLAIAGISFNLTFSGYVFYLLIIIYAAIIISILTSWKDMNGGLEDVFPGVGYFFAAVFLIFILFAVLYAFFPLQSGSLSNLGSQSLFSIFTGSLGKSTFHSTDINYSYPNSLVNINLNGVFASAGSLLSSSNSSNISNDNLTKVLENTSINVLLPTSFIVSAIGNSPEFASNLKAFNISQYTKQNNSKNARAYLENYFPELSQFYFIVTGEQKLNSSNNVSILSLSPSKFESYLKELNITKLNSSFPINATNLLYNKSYQKLGRYLPSQMFFVNMSNNVGVQLIYQSNKIFNITKVPFYSASIEMYVKNSTICFEFGADLSPSNERTFNASYSLVGSTLKCS
ncbi:hypothetical protein M1558_00420 [Candidatus Parvarchaeota archaeon]|nr:hypothetical protein [Candidatus Parvarchaeota archaeon]